MPRPRIYRTEAVVLRQRRLGDADKICVLFTPQHGRIEAVAKGLRRPTSRLAGHLEPLTQSALMLAVGRSLDIVTQAQTLDAYQPLHDDLDRLSRGLYVAELVDRFTDAAPDMGGLYRFLVATLAWLNLTPVVDLPVRWFELQLLAAEGYQPQLRRCVRCGRGLEPEGNAFSASVGGVLCSHCRTGEAGRPLSARAFKLLRFMESAPAEQVARVQVDTALGRELESHLRSAVGVALDQEVRSAAFVEAVRGRAPGTRSGAHTAGTGPSRPSPGAAGGVTMPRVVVASHPHRRCRTPAQQEE